MCLDDFYAITPHFIGACHSHRPIRNVYHPYVLDHASIAVRTKHNSPRIIRALPRISVGDGEIRTGRRRHCPVQAETVVAEIAVECEVFYESIRRQRYFHLCGGYAFGGEELRLVFAASRKSKSGAARDPNGAADGEVTDRKSDAARRVHYHLIDDRRGVEVDVRAANRDLGETVGRTAAKRECVAAYRRHFCLKRAWDGLAHVVCASEERVRPIWWHVIPLTAEPPIDFAGIFCPPIALVRLTFVRK